MLPWASHLLWRGSGGVSSGNQIETLLSPSTLIFGSSSRVVQVGNSCLALVARQMDEHKPSGTMLGVLRAAES